MNLSVIVVFDLSVAQRSINQHNSLLTSQQRCSSDLATQLPHVAEHHVQPPVPHLNEKLKLVQERPRFVCCFSVRLALLASLH